MDEDTPVNTGVVAWPDEDSASGRYGGCSSNCIVGRARTHARRFGDLFNLVYDPAFLIHAWERVSSNDGARTAGVDGSRWPRSTPGSGWRRSWARSGTC